MTPPESSPAPPLPSTAARCRVRLVALDYDGTLTHAPAPTARMLSAVAALRASGVLVVLVTGRILRELRAAAPGVDSWFDAIVCENGAVIAREGESRALTAPVGVQLSSWLAHVGAHARHGQVLAALRRADGPAALAAIAASGLDCQLIHNRGELMILPAGVTKGSGLRALLEELGISRHNVVGVGDAENDHALLEACEIGVAVGNAVPALKDRADIVLEDAGPDALAAFLEQLAQGELAPFVPKRWRARIGVTGSGELFSLPGSGVDLLVVGGSGAGKSYFAGLLAERWLALDYSVVVFDPEGDYGALTRLPGVLGVGGVEHLPSVDQLARLLHHRGGSVVVDLSLLAWDEREAYIVAALTRLEQERKDTGLPHWILVDEAHVVFRAKHQRLLRRSGGSCLVTYHPWSLATATVDAFEVIVFLRGSFADGPPTLPSVVAADEALRARLVEEVATLAQGEAVVLRLEGTPDIVRITLSERTVGHTRHWHKYLHGFLPPRLHFVFRDGLAPTGRTAANLDDFHRECRRASGDVLRHHLGNGDFSAWLRGAVCAASLADAVARIEDRVRSSAAPPHAEALRISVLQAIEDAGGDEVPPPSAAQR